MTEDVRTIVLGAGLAGMSAALELGGDYRILEREKTPGGLCITTEDNGYRFDKTGHLLHLSHPKAARLAQRLLGDSLLSIQRNSRIFSSGVYTHYPFQANTYGLPPATVSRCLKDFIRAHAVRDGRRANAETFEQFILANFGEGIAEHFMIPYNQKLWGVHPREITDAWCQRFVPTPSLDEVVDGAVGLAAEGMGYNASFLYPPKGIGELPAAMAAKLDNVELGAKVVSIDPKRRRLKTGGSWLSYENLVSSIPLDVLVRILVDPPAKIRAAGDSLRCTSLRYLDVALNKPSGTDYHWAYVPEKKYPFYRVGSYSNFSPDVAPRGKGCLYVELASRRSIDMNRVTPAVARGLEEMGIIDKPSDISFARPRFIKHAYVIYDRNRDRALNTILPWLEKRGILTVGRYGRWEYAAMEDAIVQGIDAATRIKSGEI